MTTQTRQEIMAGSVVEFFEAKQILCGVSLAVKNNRMTVLSEQNREINLAHSRVIHVSHRLLDLKSTRDELVRKLTALSDVRRSLMEHVDVEELWSLIEGEEGGFDIRELAEFVFSEAVADDHVAAVQRVLFQDRLYFQFKDGKFFARSREKIEQRRIEIEREQEKEALLVDGSRWLQAVWHRKTPPTDFQHRIQVIESLKNFYLFSQEAPDHAYVKELFKKADIPPQPSSAFRLLVRLGVWQLDENTYLYQQNIPSEFPREVEELAAERAARGAPVEERTGERLDLRDLHAFTVDSALTRDYDDALSLRTLDDGLFEVGIHIADAAEFVFPGDPLDREAEGRASSIYLPDARICMLPPVLSEGVCSLRAGEDRLALSFLIRMDAEGHIHEQRIAPSVVRIREQMTYQEVNERIQSDKFLQILYELSLKLRKFRLAHGAIILPLPEIQVHVNSAGMIQISRYEKETPSQIIVSEWMIAANGLAAAYLAERGIPAVFRSQAECKRETDFTQSEHELFHIYRQRRLFARAELDTSPRMHCSLAMPHYTSITSPIRRFIDLVAQRQLKHALKAEEPLYTEDELRRIIVELGAVQSKIFFVQRKWNRYWILKYMEQEDIHTMDALVLEQNHRFTRLLLPDFLMEAGMPTPEKAHLQSGEMIRVKIERLNPREDILRVQL